MVLAWVGNSYFGHEAIRRGRPLAPLSHTGIGGNVFRLLTAARIEQYSEEPGVPLGDEQRAVLDAVSNSTDPLLCISALAGAGKTALAHCVLKARMEGDRGSTPRHLVLYTVPTSAVREEVVLELGKLKVALVSALH